MLKRRSTYTILLIIGLLLTACGQESDQAPANTDTSTDTTAAATTAPAADAATDTTAAETNTEAEGAEAAVTGAIIAKNPSHSSPI
ncbi:MAG: hypothetical protein KC423_12880, partial [Anaerolineales bacterium]|nr:hypothetical protein [Anaerolineales bacterium]